MGFKYDVVVSLKEIKRNETRELCHKNLGQLIKVTICLL